MSSSSPFAVTTSTPHPPFNMSTMPTQSPSAASRSTLSTRFGTSPWISPCHAVHEPNAFAVSKALFKNKPRRPSPLSKQILVELNEVEPGSHSKSSVQPSPSSGKRSVSRLCYPFVKSKSPALKPKPAIMVSSDGSSALPSEPKQDHSTRDLPGQSPTPTPTHSLSSRPSRSPHSDYRHYGYSRQALAHIKWFWVTREEEWEEKAGPVRKNKPQLDMSFLEAALDDPFMSFHAQKQMDRMHPLHQPQTKLPPMTVYPRRGDLTALRDPFCTQLDRLFADLPAWTIGKTLWMYDMHVALHGRVARLDGVESTTPSDVFDEAESETESSYTPAPSVIFSDDSDATLVESETEADLLPVALTSAFASGSTLPGDFGFDSCANHCWSSLCDQASSVAFSSFTPVQPSVVDWSRTAYQEPPIMSSDGLSKPSARQSGWRTNWYRRWEYMIQLSRSQSPNGFGINSTTPS